MSNSNTLKVLGWGPVFIGIGLAACLAACSEAVVDPAPERNAAESLQIALDSLSAADVPHAPIAPVSTREDREEYLIATETALSALHAFAESPDHTSVTMRHVTPDDILAVSRMLAVEVADAIDRSDSVRAKRSVQSAFALRATVCRPSLTTWVEAAAIADSLATGIRSVAPQLDDDLAEELKTVIEFETSRSIDPGPTLMEEIAAIRTWFSEFLSVGEDVRFAEVTRHFGEQPGGRPVLSQEVSLLIEERADDEGNLPSVWVRSEADAAQTIVENYIESARDGSPILYSLPNAIDHPLAHVIAAWFRLRVEPAPRLRELQAESNSLLLLTVRIIAADVPQNLEQFGALAVSPYSGLPFEYTVNDNGFTLVRPREAPTEGGTTESG